MAEFSLILYGKADQGIRTTTNILAKTAFLCKYQVKAWYFREKFQRTGIATGFMRFSDKPIETNEKIEKTDFLLVFNRLTDDILKLCRDESVVIANSSDRIKNNYISQHKIKCHAVDASGISARIFGGEVPGPAMIGAFAKISGKISMKNVKEAVKQEIDFQTSENQAAMEEGYKTVKLR